MVSIFKIGSPLVAASPAGLDFTAPQGPEFSSILNGAMNNVQNPETAVDAEQMGQPVPVPTEGQNPNPENAATEEVVSEEIKLSDTKPDEKEETAESSELDLAMNYPVCFHLGLAGLAANTSGFENSRVLQGESSANAASRSQEVSMIENSDMSRQAPLEWTQTKAADAGDYGQPALELSAGTSETSPQTVQADINPQADRRELNLQDAHDFGSGLQLESASAEKQSFSDLTGLNLSGIQENPQYEASTKPYGDTGGKPDAKPVGEFKTNLQAAIRHESAEFSVAGQARLPEIVEVNEKSVFEFQPLSHKADDEIKASKQPEGIGVDKLAGLQFARFNLSTASVENSGGTNLSAPAEVPVYEQIFDEVKVNLDLGKNSFSIKLKPEGLGELQVKMTMDDGKVVLELDTSLASTRDLISSQINELKSALANSSIQVTDFTINCTGETNPGIFSFDSFGSGFGRDTGRQAYYDEQPEIFADYSEFKEKSPKAVLAPGRLNYKI